MGAIICSVEENRLLRRITVRQFCKDEELKALAIVLAVVTLEKIEQMEDLKLYEGQYVENRENSSYFSRMPIEVSYSVLYRTDDAKKKLLKLIENYQ